MSFRLFSAPGNKFAYLKLWNKLARERPYKNHKPNYYPPAGHVCVCVRACPLSQGDSVPGPFLVRITEKHSQVQLYDAYQTNITIHVNKNNRGQSTSCELIWWNIILKWAPTGFLPIHKNTPVINESCVAINS